MTITNEAVAVIVRLTCLPKNEAFELLNEWVPWVTDEELEIMWQMRSERIN
jgi:hypothetical protein